MITHILLERLSITRAAGGKALAVAPDRVETIGRFVDEFVDVIVPAAVKVGREQQPVIVVDDHPAREMDGRDDPDRARAAGIEASQYAAQLLDAPRLDCDKRRDNV